MNITKIYKVPTGHIIVAKGEEGPLEFLSIGDYGKAKNIKADFLGLRKEIDGVPNGEIMPLEEKWVITISTQYGCSMKCRFCDVPKVGPGRNIKLLDLLGQVYAAVNLHPEVTHTKRLNLHYARMGEPSWNREVPDSAIKLLSYFTEKKFHFHPVVTTMCPKNNPKLERFLFRWLGIKNSTLKGEAGLQISINSCSEEQRNWLFQDCSLSLEDISRLMIKLIGQLGVRGRKIALNFPITKQTTIDGRALRKLFNPKHFMVKITPIHEAKEAAVNNLFTTVGYHDYSFYKPAEEEFKKWGFDTLVFIPSLDEDQSLITCGNAVLSGSKPRC